MIAFLEVSAISLKLDLACAKARVGVTNKRVSSSSYFSFILSSGIILNANFSSKADIGSRIITHKTLKIECVRAIPNIEACSLNKGI